MGEDLLGGVFQGVGTLTSGILNYKLGKQQLKVAKEQLQEQKAMNEWEKQKYNTTLNNQKSGIATLGKAFEGVAYQNNAKPATPTPAPAENKELPTQRM